MLKLVERSEIPEDTAKLGEKLLEDDDIYRVIGEELPDLIKDEDFADMYSPIGGPALSPALLSLVLIFQMLEKIPDRLAAKAVRLRIDWKYALHLPLDWEGFYFTNLSHFRQRLLEHGAEYRVFDILLKKLVKLGYIRRRGKQRTDSMSVLGYVANLSRLEMVWETLRVVLKAIEKTAPDWLTCVFPESFLQRYLEKRTDYKLTKVEIEEKLHQAGADGLRLLEQLEKAPAALQDLHEVETMREIWEQQFECDKDEDIIPREKLGAHDLIQSPHEPEVRYRKKRDKVWQGFVAQVTETAEDKGDPNFVVDVGLTGAQESDCNALPEIQERLEERGLTPEEQYVDQAYVSGTNLAKSKEKGIDLMGPVAGEVGPKEFKMSDFDIDLEEKTATCPAENESLYWTEHARSDGTLNYVAHFGEQCLACPLRSRCTASKAGRTLTIHEHHDVVVKQREKMQTEEFWIAMKRRPPIEGTISQVARQGMRQARYRGRDKNNLQLIFTATAMNLQRLCRVLESNKKPSWWLENTKNESKIASDSQI